MRVKLRGPAVRLLRALLLGASWFALASAARAQTDEAYDKAIREAVVEFSQGHWDEAHALFQRAHEASPSARTSRGLGLSAFESRRYVEAVAELEAALSDVRKPLTPEQRAEVSNVLARARAFVAIYRVSAAPSDAELLVDGVPAQLRDQQLYLDPGAHTLLLRAPGYDDRALDLRAEAGARKALHLELRKTVTGGPAAPQSAAAPVQARTRVWTWTLSSATLASGAATLGVALRGATLRDEFDRNKDSGECSRSFAECTELRDRGRRFERTANALLGATGGLLLGSFTAFFFEAKRAQHSERAAITLTPRGLFVQGRF